MTAQYKSQSVPVRIYQTESRIMIAAPMPGLEPENISISIDGEKVILRGELRGPRQDERDLMVAEWTVGPYYREITLPEPVSGELTNATYGNGVVVLSMPRLKSGQENWPVEFQLEAYDSTRGERIGHEGLAIIPTTTERVREDRAERARTASEVF